MNYHKSSILFAFILIILCSGSIFPVNINAQEMRQSSVIPEGIYIEMTREFYEALKNEGRDDVKLYSNNPSTDYLKQISISARFMVETNLQIIRQQELIIQLLQTLGEDQKK